MDCNGAINSIDALWVPFLISDLVRSLGLGCPGSAGEIRTAEQLLLAEAHVVDLDLPALPKTGNPKLAFHLVLLADAAAEAEAAGQQLTASSPRPAFPRELRGMIAARQLRLTETGGVQVFVIVDEMSRDSRDALEALGAQIERVDEEALIVQAQVPAESLRQIANLPDVRKVRLPDYPVFQAGSRMTEGAQGGRRPANHWRASVRAFRCAYARRRSPG